MWHINEEKVHITVEMNICKYLTLCCAIGKLQLVDLFLKCSTTRQSVSIITPLMMISPTEAMTNSQT